MNRRDCVTAVAYWEAVAAAANERAKRLRADLDADARAEYEEQLTAPTWRITDVAVVSASVSRRAVVVADARAFARWVARRYPTEVEPSVRESWQGTFLKRVEVDEDGTVRDGDEVVPGLALRRGGEYRSVSVKVTPAAQQLLAELAENTVRRVAVESGVPGLLELEAAEVPA